MTRSSQRQLSPQASEPNTTKLPVSQNHAQSNGFATQPSATMQEVENGERPVREKLKNTSIAATISDPGSPPEPDLDTAMANDDSTKSSNMITGSEPKERGSLKKKRSFEDVEAADNSQDHSKHPEKHVRKRSRSREPESPEEDSAPQDAKMSPNTSGADASAENSDQNGSKEAQMVQDKQPSTPSAEAEENMQDSKEGLTSPKNKRSREEFLEDHAEDKVEPTGESEKKNIASDINLEDLENDKGTPSGEPKSKRHRDSSSPQPEDAKSIAKSETETTATKVPTSSGFADTSASSPFGSLSGPKAPTEQPQTSAGAFAKSGFSSFASTSSSPFGAAGAKATEGSKSPFGAVAGDKPALSTFGSAKPLSSSSASTTSESKGFGGVGSSEKSPFATAGAGKTSGFGSGTSGFGSLAGGLSSFASKPGTATFGSSKPTTTFGAAATEDDEEETEEGGEGDETAAATEADKQDERFHIQDVNTGEDDESTRFQSRTKLYAFMAVDGSTQKTWKERGVGTVKLNVSKADDEKPDEPPKVRLIMRADGSQRVVLNTPVLKDIRFGDAQGDKPTGQTMLFRGTIDEKPELELLQLKMKPPYIAELWQQITELQEDM
ncbi:hypothetical protein EV356DRAFT_512286 [Viridothelium virens]|uniref:RanBD1 domain-containing protein n=1 Tax=Viridothelium virens TaxID=1048519 RepID=A0A6A6HHJ7_VIRVR|nr:hypothetical protein EV356DRAFT_512286 [Viridothelium virens]